MLTQAMRELAPAVVAVFARWKTHDTVAGTAALLGELKRGRALAYRSAEVFLAANVFTADFAGALAVFLHEHADVIGYDGSRGFTDALTELLAAAVRCRGELDAHEVRWEAAREQVARERAGRRAWGPRTAADLLGGKDEAELRAILGRIPEAVLRKYCLAGEGETGGDRGRIAFPGPSPRRSASPTAPSRD